MNCQCDRITCPECYPPVPTASTKMLTLGGKESADALCKAAKDLIAYEDGTMPYQEGVVLMTHGEVWANLRRAVEAYDGKKAKDRKGL